MHGWHVMPLDESAHVLLTGGTGFFGKALLRHWHEQQCTGWRGPRITVLSRSPTEFLSLHPEFANLQGLQWVAADILVPDSLPRHERFSHVLHAASDSTRGPQLTPRQRFEQIVDGTRHLLDCARRCGAQRFLLTSSGAVYGPQPSDCLELPEDWHGAPDPMNPDHAYGEAKRAAENLCATYRHEFGLETVVARCFAFVGADLPLNVHFAIGNFIRDALHAKAITVQGDGSPVRSYLEQNDLANWLWVLLNQGRGGQAYNVGSDQAISLHDLAHLVRDLLAPAKTVHIQNQEAASLRSRYVPSIAKACNDLGVCVTVPLTQAILSTAAAHLGPTSSPRLTGANP